VGYYVNMKDRLQQFKINNLTPEPEDDPLYTAPIKVTPEKEKITDVTFAPEASIGSPITAEEFKIKEPAEALAKGTIQGALGTPMDLVGLATGLLNMLTVDPEQKGNLEQFAEGYGAVPFTSEKIKTILEDMGWKAPEGTESAELIGELIAPSKAISSGIKGVAKVLKKTKDAGSVKKLFNVPSTVYHGTDAKFDTFKSSQNGIYFTDNPDVAKDFGKNIKQVKLKLNNPYVIDDFRFDSGLGEKFELFKNNLKSKIGMKNYNDQTIKSNAWTVQPETIQRLKEKGYDGIVVPKGVAANLKGNNYIVFDESQIQIKGK